MHNSAMYLPLSYLGSIDLNCQATSAVSTKIEIARPCNIDRASFPMLLKQREDPLLGELYAALHMVG